jgi:hypothetical protein
MEHTQDSLNTAPEKLVRGFTSTRIMFWVIVAVAMHIAFAAATSVDYIRDTWIDPEGAAQRKAAADAAANNEPEQPAAPATPSAPSETGEVTAGSADATSEAALLEQRKDTPVVEAVTELPAADEIPRHPDDLGISIGDTNE